MFVNGTALLAQANQHSLSHYLRSHYGDRTFKGLYRLNWFDLTLLVPYFLVMVILAVYGMHRYQLVYLYYKHRKNAAKEPPALFEQLPRVTVQLPIFNEQFVIDRLIEACCNLDVLTKLLAYQYDPDSAHPER
jgi:hypothetical protein